MHDAQAEPFRLLHGRAEAAAVILDAQQSAIAVAAQFDLNVARVPVLGGVGHRFLGNTVQMQRVDGLEAAIERVFRYAAHIDVEHGREATRELLERERQAATVEGDR